MWIELAAFVTFDVSGLHVRPLLVLEQSCAPFVLLLALVTLIELF